jgi:hypothetical protein
MNLCSIIITVGFDDGNSILVSDRQGGMFLILMERKRYFLVLRVFSMAYLCARNLGLQMA